jgi:hypothetical protein
VKRLILLSNRQKIKRAMKKPTTPFAGWYDRKKVVPLFVHRSGEIAPVNKPQPIDNAGRPACLAASHRRNVRVCRIAHGRKFAIGVIGAAHVMRPIVRRCNART